MSEVRCESSPEAEAEREAAAAGERPALEAEDFYWEGGLMVFTAAFHLKRGYCCRSGCRHCPFD